MIQYKFQFQQFTDIAYLVYMYGIPDGEMSIVDIDDRCLIDEAHLSSVRGPAHAI